MFNSKWYSILKKVILVFLFCCCCATLLLTWQEVRNVQTLDGTVIFTGNICLTAIIGGMYLLSVLFYEKAKGIFFCTGLSSLSMLFAIMLAKFESWGRFANHCIGPYVGLATVLLTIGIYVFANVKDKSQK